MGTDKALLELEGKTLLHRAVEFCSSFCNEIRISSNIPEHKVEGCKRIPDEIIDCGPIGGIYSCLKQSNNDWNFVLSVDAVFVEKEFVKEMMKQTEDFDAIIPVHARGKEPLIALYHRKTAETIFRQIKKENYRLTDLLDLINTRWFDAQKWVEKKPRIFHNLNRPDDLAGIN